MKIVYTHEEPPKSFSKSLFLAGPTSRSKDVKSWRPEALRILEEKGYAGVVFVPEEREGVCLDWQGQFEDIVDWEHKCLNMADCILFWVPRERKLLPGFTTNVEFGLYVKSGRAVFGAPPEAEDINYLKSLARRNFLPQASTLEETIDLALKLIGDGSLRESGEREVPLNIWNTFSFQEWYESQKNAGNRLDGATPHWVYKIGPKKGIVFYWVLHANVYVAKENRNKTNEVIFSRYNISTVVLYRRDKNLLKSKVVLVREFRSSANTKDGFIWELPGGSSLYINDPLKIAIEEVHEEVGLEFLPHRFRYEGGRQLAGTFSTHRAHLYSVELLEKEVEKLQEQKNIPHGMDLNNPTGERAYTEVCTLEEILNKGLCDWSNIGMILSVLKSVY